MSILLEALKKSEQTRKLGETPGLATPVEDEAAPGMTAGGMVPVLLIVLSAIVMAWFGWQQFTRPEPGATAGEPPVVSTREDPAPAIADEQEPGPRTLTENYRAREERQNLQQSVEQFVAEQEPGPEPAEPDSDPAADAEEAIERLAQETEPEEPAADPGLAPHIAEPISYWELPQGVRDTLPEIKITVLVYAEEPSDRFLLSNGQRLVEKDELDGGLVLDEIRRDGAVFKYRKYRFLVKG